MSSRGRTNLSEAAMVWSPGVIYAAGRPNRKERSPGDLGVVATYRPQVQDHRRIRLSAMSARAKSPPAAARTRRSRVRIRDCPRSEASGASADPTPADKKGVGPSKYEFEGPTVDHKLVTSRNLPGSSAGLTRRHPCCSPSLPGEPDRFRFRSRLTLRLGVAQCLLARHPLCKTDSQDLSLSSQAYADHTAALINARDLDIDRAP